MAARAENRRSVNDEDLLDLARAGGDGFALFYRRSVGWVLRFCARRTRDPELAADLTAEVFAAALLAVRRYRRERGTARNWLLGIAVHKLANLERDGAVERRVRLNIVSGEFCFSRVRSCEPFRRTGVPGFQPSLRLGVVFDAPPTPVMRTAPASPASGRPTKRGTRNGFGAPSFCASAGSSTP